LLAQLGYFQDIPDIGRKVPEEHVESLRELTHLNYRIIYKRYNDSIRILAVVHAARELDRVLPQNPE